MENLKTDPEYPEDGKCWGCGERAEWVHLCAYLPHTKGEIECQAFLECTGCGATLKGEKDISLSEWEKFKAFWHSVWRGFKARSR